jgi:hypothetical protein
MHAFVAYVCICASAASGIARVSTERSLTTGVFVFHGCFSPYLFSSLCHKLLSRLTP